MKKSILGLNTTANTTANALSHSNNPLDLSLASANPASTMNKRNKVNTNSLSVLYSNSGINSTINKTNVSLINTSTSSSAFNNLKKLSVNSVNSRNSGNSSIRVNVSYT